MSTHHERILFVCSSVLALGLACACACACGGGGDSAEGEPGGPGSATSEGGTKGDATTTSPEAGSTSSCTDGESVCSAFDRRKICRSEGGALTWVTETCAAGSGCFKGACVAARCSDECTLGTSDAGRSCASWDIKSAAWQPHAPATSLHDRAREYTRWVQRDHLPFGGLADVRFSDPPAYATPIERETGDSALWTGTYLASEAWRLLATGAVDARAHVRALVQTLHLWFNISPSPGVLARFVQPAGTNSPSNGINCTKNTHHCNVTYEGKAYDYNGHVSRDQYQGVMLGYALAYEALGSEDEATRALIRDDVLMLLDELMKEREVDGKLTYQGVTLPAKLKARFMVVVQEELDGGAIKLSYDGDKGGWVGFQEFMPDLADLFKQVPLLGAVVPASIPRDSSAIMLASFFRIGLRVTEGVPALATRRAALETFYLSNTGRGGNVHDWLKIAGGWSRSGDDCGKSYYANNIAMQPLYNWARLEKDASIRASAVDLVTTKAWPAFADQKNTFFTYLTGANMTAPAPAVLAAARVQLAQFPPTRVTRLPVDLLSDPRFEPHQSSCPEKGSNAEPIDIAERPNDGFVWQRDPWGLQQSGDPGMTHPGVDYLAAYWLGRRHDFVDDDAASRCLRWK